MRIALLSTIATGGATIAAFRLMRSLRKAGHDCSLFVMEPGGISGAEPLCPEHDGKGPYFSLLMFSHWNGLSTAETRLEGKCELFSDQLVALNPLLPLPPKLLDADIVHLHWVSGMFFSPVLLGALRGKKIAWTLHDFNAFTGGCHYHISCRKFERHCENCPMLAPGPLLYDMSAACFDLKGAVYPKLDPAIVSPSHWLAAEAEKSDLLKNRTIEVIPNCCETSIFRPLDQAEQRKKIGIGKDALVLLAGSESLENLRKNMETFWEAVRLLSVQLPDLPVEIITYGNGKTPALPYPVHSQGYVDEEERMVSLYNAADLYVHPALLDNLPNTMCEAQCCGTPVLAFDVGGCSEAMLPERTGFTVQESTPEALCEKLREILLNPQQLRAMRGPSRAFALERFNEQTIAAAYVKVYQSARAAPGIEEHTALHTLLLSNQVVSLSKLYRQDMLLHENNIFSIEQNIQKIQRGLQKQIRELKQKNADLEAALNNLREKARPSVRSLARNMLSRNVTKIRKALCDFAFIRPNKRKSSQERVLVVRIDAIGDYMLFRQALRRLRQSPRLQGKHVTLCGNAVWEKIARELDGDCFDEFIPFIRTKFSEIGYRRSILRRVRDVGAGIAVHPVFSREYMGDMLMIASGAPVKIGFQGDTLNIHKARKRVTDFFYTELIKDATEHPFEFIRNMELLQYLGVECGTVGIRDAFPERLLQHVAKEVRQHLGLPVVFIGSSMESKRWPIGNCVAVARHFWKSHGTKVLFCGSKSDITQNDRFILDDEPSVVSLIGRTSLIDMLALIRYAPFLLSSDTMAVHVAATYGTPAVAMLKGQFFGRFLPYPAHIAPNIITVFPDGLDADSPDIKQQYYGEAFAPYSMDAIRVRTVLDALERLEFRASV